jgi:arsenate reductase
MAEALLNTFHSDQYEGYSAGIEATHVNPNVIKSMAEIGINISTQRSKNLDEFKGEKFDYVVTVCDRAKEVCPFFPGKQVLHKSFLDPSAFTGPDEKILKETSQVRDKIKDWIDKTFR